MDLNKITEVFEEKDKEANKVAAILSYMWILVIVTLIIAPDSKYAKYHANQGLSLLICEVIYGIVKNILGVICGFIPFIGGIIMALYGLLGIVFFIFRLLGIINVIKGEAKPLPIIGNIQLIK